MMPHKRLEKDLFQDGGRLKVSGDKTRMKWGRGEAVEGRKS